MRWWYAPATSPLGDIWQSDRLRLLVQPGWQPDADVCMNILFEAQASTIEEPDAGKLHVRVCAVGLW